MPELRFLKDGTSRNFDCSYYAVNRFGFLPNQRVMTPRGPARVVGVRDMLLYFHVETDAGASHWSKCKTVRDFEERGFFPIADDNAGPGSDPRRFHRLKHVKFNGQDRVCILQAVNGPCPIFALVNALLLQGELYDVIDVNKTFVDSEELRQALLDYLVKSHPGPTPVVVDAIPKCDKKLLGAVVKDIAEIDKYRAVLKDSGVKVLKALYDGLVVNPVFWDIDAFAMQNSNADPDMELKSLLFAYAGIRLLHAWVIDPNDDVLKNLRSLTYDDVTALRTDLSQEVGRQANSFVESREFSSQITTFGMQRLYESVKEGEIVVLFWHNHFSTVTKLKGRLLQLVSDESCFDRSLIVFQELSEGSSYCDGVGDRLPDYVLKVISEHGNKYNREDIEKARNSLKSDSDPTFSPSSDMVVRKLQAMLPNGSVQPVRPPPKKSTPQTATPEQQVVVPDVITSSTLEGHVKQLMDMGFSEDMCRRAMQNCGSVEQATEWIFNHM